MSLVLFVVGASLFVAVLIGFRRPLREFGIPTPLGTGVILMVIGAYVAWSAPRSESKVERRRRQTESSAGAKAVHVILGGDARPPGLDETIRQHLEERFTGAGGVVVVDLYYRSMEGFVITRAELSVTEMASLDTAPLDTQTYVESYLDRTRAHLEAIGIKALN